MKKRRSITNTLLSLGALLISLALAPQAFAQNQPGAQAPAALPTYSVTTTRINPGMGNDYREFRKSERVPALKKGGVKQQGVWTTANFGEGGEYVTLDLLDSLF